MFCIKASDLRLDLTLTIPVPICKVLKNNPIFKGSQQNLNILLQQKYDSTTNRLFPAGCRIREWLREKIKFEPMKASHHHNRSGNTQLTAQGAAFTYRIDGRSSSRD